jgi:hypothetical protein
MAGVSFTAKDFIAKLRQGRFASAPVAATGLVKLSEEDKNALLFAHGTDCTNWISVPVSLIDRVDFLRVMPCKDHSHPLVTLIFSAPQSPEAQTFAAIANLTSTTSSTPAVTRAVPVHAAPIAYHPLPIHPFPTRFNVASAGSANDTVSPNPDGKCPDGYYWCGIGQGCCPVFA